MPVKISCPKCRAGFVVPDEHLGKSLRCRECKAVFTAKAPAKAARDEEEEAPRRKGDSADREAVRDRPAAARRPRDEEDDRDDRRERGRKNGGRDRDDDDDDRRPAKKSRSPKGGQGGALPWIIAAGAAGLVLVVLCVGGLVWAMSRGAPSTQPVAQKPGDNPQRPGGNPDPGPALANGQLPPEVLGKVKHATAFIRVRMADGSGASGSGFAAAVANEPGVVLTNAHVLGMLEAESRPPISVDVTFNSGEADERKFAAQILGVDRSSDLAVLRVAGAGLPAPLEVKSAAGLVETQKVYVFGFPLGERLGKEITVRDSSVASLRKENGLLSKVQVHGGMDPGNSGGPVVDARGDVVGVAVSGIRTTQINFAVPGDFVKIILAGRLSGALADSQAYVQPGGALGLPVRVTVLDPLARVKSVGLDIWAGDGAAPRGPATQQPPKAPGDSDHLHANLLVGPADGGGARPGERLASGDVLLPPLPPGKVYWVQPTLVNALGETHWGGGMSLVMDFNANPAVERKPATLALRHQAAVRKMELTCTDTFKLRADDEDHALSMLVIGNMVEETQPDPVGGGARVVLQYERFRMDLTEDGERVERSERIANLVKHVPSVVGVLYVDAQGNLTKNDANLTRVPPAAREAAGDMHERIQHSLDALAVPLPNRLVQPGETWRAWRTLPIDTAGKFESGAMEMTYEYRGKRLRGGREEAVIGLKGVLRGPRGQEGRLGGWADGIALVDLATGQVTVAKTAVTVDMNAKTRFGPVKVTGSLDVKLTRAVP